MEYVGRSLYDVISERCRLNLPFSESETRRAMAQLLAGVGTMHAHGIVHRDLKPGNVLVGERDGRLKICDLGLARSVAAPPPLDAELEGTPGYMAPEVLLCEKGCGEPVDVWALGCVMAELVAGQSLFPEDDLCKQLVNIIYLLGIPDDVSLMPLGITAAAMSKLRDKVPEERLSPAGFDVLRGLLQYHPKDRLTAAAALQMQWFSDDATAM
ncbi:putative cyclin-dependent kinase F-2 [Setaria italica]|nr:putative cyclin-dependent kinase F-2 [Setaria italica]XP_034569862.1 putative cyclin-dependent kinase F-2 [Setaria viridis]